MSDRHLPTSIMKRTTEAAFLTVIEAHLLENGYVPVAGESFDRERAIFPETVRDLLVSSLLTTRREVSGFTMGKGSPQVGQGQLRNSKGEYA